jgi:hypothetical protein
MLTRIALFTCVTAACFAADNSQRSDGDFTRRWWREQEQHKKLADQPTPHQWRNGAVWRFVTTPPRGKPQMQILTFRVTDQAGVSCLADWKNVWHKFVVIEGSAPYGPPIYQVEGRALLINLSGGMCDDYDIIDGVLTGGDFNGQRRTFGLGPPSEVIGTVRGSCVRQ